MNDPNFTTFSEGIVGTDSTVAFRLSGSYRFPWEITLRVRSSPTTATRDFSNVVVTRAQAAAVGVNLARAQQAVFMAERGDERFDNVTMLDLRVSKAFRFFGTRSITPQVDVFNLGNADTAVANNAVVSTSYLFPGEILSPRIIRVGVVVAF